MRNVQKKWFVLLVACVSTAFSQLAIPHKSAADSVDLQGQMPLVLAGDSLPANIQALDDSVSTMNAETDLGEEAKNLAIYKGLELIGKSIKATASPNSAEVESIEREWQYR